MNSSDYSIEHTLDAMIVDSIHSLLICNLLQKLSIVIKDIKVIYSFCIDNNLNNYKLLYSNLLDVIYNDESTELYQEFVDKCVEITMNLVTDNFPVMKDYLTNGKSHLDYLETMNIKQPFNHPDVICIYNISTFAGELVSDENILSTIGRLDFSSYNYFYYITKLDLSKFVNLTYLHMKNNKLSEIDVSSNVKLKYLNISSNQVSELDLSKNTLLEKLYISETNITKLYLSNNKLLMIY